MGRLQWLAGCWESRADGTIIEEQWLAPAGGILLGVSRTRRGESLVGYEFTRIYSRGDSLVFAASPSGQDPAEFVAQAADDREVVFENPEHDFPQRVRYRAIGTDSLAARIEGVRAGELQGVDFRYRRVACPGSGR
ncbi:MAG TPA: DUF6265 family protein [Gemmatimonadota bacterium]|nr:DUF6265 family protein [Gemmatimonadota bacterium]